MRGKRKVVNEEEKKIQWRASDAYKVGERKVQDSYEVTRRQV